jgi:hypothetical protein
MGKYQTFQTFHEQYATITTTTTTSITWTFQSSTSLPKKQRQTTGDSIGASVEEELKSFLPSVAKFNNL